MDISIFGGGPCGCYLSYMLAKEGYNVTLYEQESQLLGCWSTERVNNKYFTEHAPRVWFDNYKNSMEFFEEIGIDFKKEFFYVHNNLLNTTEQIKFFSLSDLALLSVYFMNPFIKQSTSVDDILKYFSLSGKKKLTELCYLWEGVSPKLFSLKVFFETLDKFLIYSMYLPKTDSDVYYLPKITQALKQYNVTIKLNSQITHIKNSVPYVNNKKVVSDKYIFCIPPKPFVKLLEKSEPDFQDNWGNLDSLQQKVKTNHYTAIGIQYHFDEKIKYKYIKDLPHIFGKWKIAWDVKHKYISTSILNLEKVNDLSETELIKGVWSQLLKENKYPLPEYKKATITPSVYKTKNKWDSSQGAYNHSVYHSFFCDHTGKLKNYHYVGSHNPSKSYLYPVTTHESTIIAAKSWLNESKLLRKELNIYTPFGIKIYVQLIILFYFIFKISKNKKL